MTIPKELHYLERLIRSRVEAESGHGNVAEPTMPAISQWELPLGHFAIGQKLDADEAVLLLIGLAHTVQPDLFHAAIEGALKKGGEFPKIGGAVGKNFRGFLPTGDTALFLLCGGDWKKRLEVQRLFAADHFFATKKILWLEDVPQGEPAMSGKIIVSQEYTDLLTRGEAAPPHFGMNFPAKLIRTELEWDHLVVNDELRAQINDLLDWKRFHDQLRGKDKDGGRFRNGYRTLFYGPPGTGKTFTASLLGKEMGKDAYRIDLSMVVSKYIGETEKNLELLFARAEDKDWILFFDEADAIFSKRTNVRDAHDKYANQEVSYLLQRIEDYNGLVILASNMRNNIDEAFIRRFNSILHFPMPDVEERKQLWEKTFMPGTKFSHDEEGGDEAELSAEAVIERIKHYQLSGGSILNIVHYASIKGARRGASPAPLREALGRGDAASGKAAGGKAASGKAASGKAGSDKAKKNPAPAKGLTVQLADIVHGIRLEFAKDNIPFKNISSK
jgi:hypothetical protein